MKKLALVLALTTSALPILPGCTPQGAPLDGEDESVGEASQASSADAYGWAMVLGNGALSSPSVFNSSGGAVVTNRDEAGVYDIDFMGIPFTHPMNAQAVAYGSNAHCKLFTVAQGDATKTSLHVLCYTAVGVPVDSAFVVTLDFGSGNSTAPNRGAFLTTAAHGGKPPAVFQSYNSTSGINTVAWSEAEQGYVVTFPGMTFDNASVQITALGLRPNPNRCKVVSWSSGVVHVKCFDELTGAPVSNTGFSLSYQERSQIRGRIGAHASFSNGAMSSLYRGGVGNLECDTPTFSSTPYQNSVLVSITDTNGPGYGQNIVPMISATGSSTDYCNVVGWGTDGTTSNVLVSCFDATGSPINATAAGLFDLTLTQNSSPGPC